MLPMFSSSQLFWIKAGDVVSIYFFPLSLKRKKVIKSIYLFIHSFVHLFIFVGHKCHIGTQKAYFYMILRLTERDMKLDMETKENLKWFSIGGEAGWYVTPLHFQTKIWILNDNFYVFPLFYYLTAPSFCPTKRKAVCFA